MNNGCSFKSDDALLALQVFSWIIASIPYRKIRLSIFPIIDLSQNVHNIRIGKLMNNCPPGNTTWTFVAELCLLTIRSPIFCM